MTRSSSSVHPGSEPQEDIPLTTISIHHENIHLANVSMPPVNMPQEPVPSPMKRITPTTDGEKDILEQSTNDVTVSYTHLTLPTNREV